MRTITITVPDVIAEELEADAQNNGRNLADFAGEKFAIAYNAVPARLSGVGAPNTKWMNGKPLYVRPETPTAWLPQTEEPKDPLLVLLEQ